MTISNEAVEAAAKAFSPNAWDPTALLFVAHGETLEASRRRAQEAARNAARAALEAAAPIIRAEAIRAAAEQMREERHSWCLDDAGRYWIKRTLDDLAERAVAERGRQ